MFRNVFFLFVGLFFAASSLICVARPAVDATQAIVDAGDIARNQGWLNVSVQFYANVDAPDPMVIRFLRSSDLCLLTFSASHKQWQDILLNFESADRQIAMTGFMLHEIVHCAEQKILTGPVERSGFYMKEKVTQSPEWLRECLADAVAAAYWKSLGKMDIVKAWINYRARPSESTRNTGRCIHRSQPSMNFFESAIALRLQLASEK